jgi:dolichol-phosphate mannosyltransferase
MVARRLARGRRRAAPLGLGAVAPAGAVSVLVPARDEEARLGPLLDGLAGCGAELLEVLVVDDESHDGTRGVVLAAAARDPRVRLLDGAPLPDGWVGKQWALQQALEQARAPWVLALDADARPDPGLAAALVARAVADGLDALSGAPRFVVDTVGERLLHPALLATLVYRFGPPGPLAPGRELWNGQCLLLRRTALVDADGWAAVADRMTEDVALARHLGRRGWRLALVDASPLLAVDMHASAREAWREWGRSLALPGVASPGEQARDAVTVALALGLPLPVLALAVRRRDPVAASVAGALLLMRIGLHAALRGSYVQRGAAWWAAPLADGLAAVRLASGSLAPSRRWRGRSYGAPAAGFSMPWRRSARSASSARTPMATSSPTVTASSRPGP